MKKLGALFALISLLSLMPAAFAADSDVPAPRPKDNSTVSSGVSDNQHQKTSKTSRSESRSEDQPYHLGDLRQPGLYMGEDGVYHNVPTAQDARQRLY